MALHQLLKEMPGRYKPSWLYVYPWGLELGGGDFHFLLNIFPFPQSYITFIKE